MRNTDRTGHDESGAVSESLSDALLRGVVADENVSASFRRQRDTHDDRVFPVSPE
jgi:hypothetical protein